MLYSFVKAGCISHSREEVNQHISKLYPLNYNKFFWWRSYTDRVVPLGKRHPLKERILNGDFNPSSYIWQAQLALYDALDKLDLSIHSPQHQIEMLAVDFSRYKRLMDDYHKEETTRLDALYEAFTSAYKVTLIELENMLLEFPGDILGFYRYAEEFLHQTPSEVRKNKRGRPKKYS